RLAEVGAQHARPALLPEGEGDGRGPKDPLMADLMSMNERFDQAKGILVDPERTAFFFVTLPLALPIAVVRRFIGMVQKFSIPIGGVIVNEVLRPEIALQNGAGEYLANKYHEQMGYMKVLNR